MNPSSTPTVLIVNPDLLSSSRLESALKSLGWSVITARTQDEALARLHHLTPTLVLINFNIEGLQPLVITERAKSLHPSIKVLGFISHTRLSEMRPKAQIAGCDKLVANSALQERLPQILAGLFPKRAALKNAK
ncbi:response regulator [Chthonomonas calidirosea]|uniref:response regulator n=1 Tax=Chthonomonas calidirosea TaxID=454171 RepID=UPI0006ECC46E|nr:response regulator [Chthonomonas calidirosea]CEK19717.1 Response regulator receiver domain protein [Chthonomonas calidirosea]